MSAVSAKSFQSLINVCPKTVQYLLIICTKFVENLSKFYSISAQNLLKNRIESFLNLSKKTDKIWRNMAQSRFFKICLNCVQHMYTLFPICSNSVHSMITISKNVCHHPTKYAEMWQSMFNICSNYVSIVSKLCWKFLPYMSKTVQKLSTFCLTSAQNLLKISPTSH